jgi:hypothetical protein
MLRRCLTAARASTYPDVELIVVDDSSTEPVVTLAESFGARTLRLDGGPFGPAEARNRGAKLAHGSILFFTDADCVIHPDAIRLAVENLADPSVDAVFGSYDEEPDDPGFISQYKNLFHHWVHRQSGGEASTFWSGCGAIRRDVFFDLGGFDSAAYRRPSIEDIELGVRLHQRGGRIVLDQRILARHLKRWTLGGLIKTDVRDRGAPWTALILRTRELPTDLNLKPAERVSALMAVGGAFGLLLTPVWWPLGVVGAGLIATVIVLNREFYRFFARRRGWPFALRTIPLHLLYYLYSTASLGFGVVMYARQSLTARPLNANEHSVPKGEREHRRVATSVER